MKTNVKPITTRTLRKTIYNKSEVVPGPASSIGRAFAFKSSDPSSNTSGTSFAVATICTTSIFQTTDKKEELDSTANFNSLDLGEKEM